jgi:hypothetical protein
MGFGPYWSVIREYINSCYLKTVTVTVLYKKKLTYSLMMEQ